MYLCSLYIYCVQMKMADLLKIYNEIKLLLYPEVHGCIFITINPVHLHDADESKNKTTVTPKRIYSNYLDLQSLMGNAIILEENDLINC